MTSLAVPCGSTVTMTTHHALTHRCPYRDELDEGRIEIGWTTAGQTLELHALTAWLDGFRDDAISHEDITADIRDHLCAQPGIADVRVVTTWVTAGATVEVRGAVPGEPVHTGGA
jgi:NADPH-dependent 7-cyano-7-deazaguanine reductase QueF